VLCVSDADVLHAAELLRRSGKGQATLISLEGAAAPAPRALPDPSARPLSDFTRPNPRIARVYETFVARIFVADSAADALRLARQHPDCAFVTREGELARGSMLVGGALDAAVETLLFGREARVRDLKTRLAALELDRADCEAREAEMAARETAIGENIKAYGVALPKLQVDLADLSSKRDHLGGFKTKLEDEIALADAELGETSAKIEEMRTQETALRESLGRMAEETAALEAAVQANQGLLETKGAEKENLLVELTRLRSAYETLADRTERARKDLERAAEALAFETETRAAQEAERSRLADRSEGLRVQIQVIEEVVARSGAARALLAQRRDGVQAERERWVRNVQDLEFRKAESEESLLRAQKAYHELQVALNGAEHEIERIRERILANYQVDLAAGAEEGGEEPELVVSPEEAEEFERLREKVAKMGPVNVLAIEEYEELQKRYTFLMQEQQDLLAAKDDIHKAILKINRQTRELFADAFMKIQSGFVEYFKLLFGGGTAELVLLDESDVLESGIEIVARPPGKKLQNITLMSGGEKALTAIALLFAVLKVRPTPFCVLDEIDAALDELNVQRFASVLQEFVRGSQFIVVTHNKRTMALADVLYGITMQQTGMSRVVSVKFAGEEEKPAEDRQVLV
jgi:chromosome segregation protein